MSFQSNSPVEVSLRYLGFSWGRDPQVGDKLLLSNYNGTRVATIIEIHGNKAKLDTGEILVP